VLQDCVSQLAVLGAIAPVSKESSQSMVDTVVGEEIGEVVQDTRQLEREYDRLLAERQQLQDNGATVAVLKENEDAVRQIARQLKQSTQVLVKNLRQSPGDVENMAKMQRERQQVQDWLRDTRQELLDMGSFSSLTSAVANEIKSKADVVEAIRNADHGRQTAANLLVELEDVRVDTEQAMKDLDEEIAQLKDQLQETKARVALESKYIKREAAVRVSVAKKKGEMHLQSLQKQVDETRGLESEEQNCSQDLIEFLKENFEDLTEKQEEWMKKAETDTETKQQELDELKRNRAHDLAALQELTEKYKDYEQVCKDDRQSREDSRIAAQLAVKKLASAIKIQAWWRGMLVRHKMGPFKSKKGKGKGKGKGKKKKK